MALRDIYLDEISQWDHAQYLKEGLVLAENTNNAAEHPHPVRTNFIVMAFCEEGHAQYTINTRKLHVNPGDLFFISERHVVDDTEASTDFKCQYILVSTKFYHGFVQNVQNVSSLLLFSRNNPVVALTQEEIAVFQSYYNLIWQKMENHEHHFRTDLVKALLLAMFYDLSNVIWRVGKMQSGKSRRGDTIFENFIRLVEENYRTERRVSWYAEQLGISGKYLSEVIKHVSQRTPNQWIDDYVVLEIRVQLKNTNKSVREIAQELRFANQSFLGKYFKEHVGISPTEFRKR
jgi:AraC-like DNA-binding protein/quercetin dioxygenase-like cupin family protein